MTRALVTGLGAITPIGLTAPEFWANLVAGVSGAGPITRFDVHVCRPEDSDVPATVLHSLFRAELAAVVEAWGAYLRAETLAAELRLGAPAAGAAVSTFELADHEIEDGGRGALVIHDCHQPA